MFLICCYCQIQTSVLIIVWDVLFFLVLLLLTDKSLDIDCNYSIKILFTCKLVIYLIMTRTQRLKTRSTSAFRLIYHLVLVTNFRRDALTGEMLERLEEIFALTLSLRGWRIN
jgi:hypothetical protein